MDKLWAWIMDGADALTRGVDWLMTPLNALGPIPALLCLALVLLLAIKFLGPRVTTKRYRELQKDFKHWYNLRQEANKAEDREKGKRLARNIDQAGMNRVYYDYFFEGLMLGLVSRYLPFFLMLAYVNSSYSAQRLAEKFGQDHLFILYGGGPDQIKVGSLFFFVASYFLMLIAWWLVKLGFKKKRSKAGSAPPSAPTN